MAVTQVQSHARIRTDATAAQGGTPIWANALDSHYCIALNTLFRIRFSIASTGTTSNTTNPFQIFASRNGGAYAAVTTATTFVQSADATAGASADNSAITTSLLGGTGTFQSASGGQYDTTGATSSLIITHGDFVEFEFGLKIVSGSVGDYYDFQVYFNSLPLTTYTFTPRIVYNPKALTLAPGNVGTTDTLGTKFVSSSPAPKFGVWCLAANSNNCWATIGSFPTFPSATHVGSIQLWVNFTSAPGVFPFLIGLANDANSDNRCMMGMNTNGTAYLDYTYSSGLNHTFSGSVNICDGAWHCLEWSFSASGAWCFVDGVQLGTSVDTALSLTGPIFLNFWCQTPQPGFGPAVTGFIDEVSIWSTTLHTANYTPPTAPWVGNEAGLVALYHLNNDLVPATAISISSATCAAVAGSITPQVSAASVLAATCTALASPVTIYTPLAPLRKAAVPGSYVNETRTYSGALPGIFLNETSQPVGTVALTQALATASVGSVALQVSVTLPATTCTAVVNSSAPSISCAIPTATVQVAVGSSIPFVSIAAHSATATAAIGSFVPFVSVAIPSATCGALTGSVLPSLSFILSSTICTAAIRSVVPQVAISAAVASCSVVVRSFVPSISIALAIAVGTAATGSIAPQVSASQATSCTAVIGSVTPTVPDLTLIGSSGLTYGLTVGSPKFGAGCIAVSGAPTNNFAYTNVFPQFPSPSNVGSIQVWSQITTAPASLQPVLCVQMGFLGGGSIGPLISMDTSGHYVIQYPTDAVGTYVTFTDTVVSTGSGWNLLEISMSASGVWAFVNGRQIGTNSIPCVSYGGPQTFLLRTQTAVNGQASTVGKVDEVSVWNSTLHTSAYTIGSGPEAGNGYTAAWIGNEPNLIALYHLDGTLANTIQVGFAIGAATCAAVVGSITPQVFISEPIAPVTASAAFISPGISFAQASCTAVVGSVIPQVFISIPIASCVASASVVVPSVQVSLAPTLSTALARNVIVSAGSSFSITGPVAFCTAIIGSVIPQVFITPLGASCSALTGLVVPQISISIIASSTAVVGSIKPQISISLQLAPCSASIGSVVPQIAVSPLVAICSSAARSITPQISISISVASCSAIIGSVIRQVAIVPLTALATGVIGFIPEIFISSSAICTAIAISISISISGGDISILIVKAGAIATVNLEIPSIAVSVLSASCSTIIGSITPKISIIPSISCLAVVGSLIRQVSVSIPVVLITTSVGTIISDLRKVLTQVSATASASRFFIAGNLQSASAIVIVGSLAPKITKVFINAQITAVIGSTVAARASYLINLASGLVGIFGSTVILKVARKLPFVVGQLNLTGLSLIPSVKRRYALASGILAFTGHTSVLLLAKKFPVQVGAFNLITHGLVFPKVQRKLVLSSGSIVETGHVSATHYGRVFGVAPGHFNITGSLFPNAKSFGIAANFGVFGVSPHASTFIHGFQVGAASGAFSVIGYASLVVDRWFTPGLGESLIWRSHFGEPDEILPIPQPRPILEGITPLIWRPEREDA